MKAVILAGGLGTRFAEETVTKPKALVTVNGTPVICEVMKQYKRHGINDFIIALGHKGEILEQFFLDQAQEVSVAELDAPSGKVDYPKVILKDASRLALVDTGEDTMTGGRIKRLAPIIKDEDFCLTYCDGVGNVDIGESILRHKRANMMATMTVVEPLSRFGVCELAGDKVVRFEEKAKQRGTWVNAGFFVLSSQIFSYIEGDATSFEQQPLKRLAATDELQAFKHHGFWHPMDSKQDRQYLEQCIKDGVAPWEDVS